MPIRRIVTSVALMAVVAGCGSSATSAPGAASASVPAATAAPTDSTAVSAPPSAASTDGLALPSFAGDPDLAAKFPKQVAGKPVTNITTARWIDFMAAFHAPQAEIDKARAQIEAIGVSFDTLVLGLGQATVGTATVQIEAVRAPGKDATQLLPVAAKLSVEDPTDTVTTETVGGKSASVVRSADGFASQWLYAKDDIIWQVHTSSKDVADAVFAALP